MTQEGKIEALSGLTTASGAGERLYLVDGTYELFRAYFAVPQSQNEGGQEVGAARGLLRSLFAMLRKGEATHVACAFDHVIESFRNRLFDGYKTGEGVPAELMSQFELAERVTRALGIVTWPMIEFEADDALATAAARFADDPRLSQVAIQSPDKDLAQCVRGGRVVLSDRRRDIVLDEDGVKAKFGVLPDSIPDYLALVGDSADGIPGIARWGARSAGAVLGEYRTLEAIPLDAAKWTIAVRGKEALAASLAEGMERAKLYRTLATLRRDVPLDETLEDCRWRGPRRPDLDELCEFVGERELLLRLNP